MSATRSCSFGRICGILLAVGGLAACTDDGPTAAGPPPTRAPSLLTALECQGSTQSRTVSCTRPSADLGVNALLVGGQGLYVQLTSSGVSYGDDIFSFLVDIQNLIPQALATTDGTTGTAEGVRIFFHGGPTVVTGSGAITVANADGSETFTGANQPYFQYSGGLLGADGILATNETSGTKEWRLSMPPTVTTFSFVLLVAADVQYPDGWIDVTPGADTLVAGGARSLTGVVRSVVGNPLPDAITWGTSDPLVATVDGAGNVSAVAPGFVTLTATAGARSGSATLAVCPDLAVGDVYVGTMPGAASLCLAGGASGVAEYTYMPVNFSPSTALSLTLTGSGIVGVTGPPTPDLRDGLPLLDGAADAWQDDPTHLARLERDRAEARRLLGNPDALIRRGRVPGGPSRLIVPGVPSVGDLWQLNVAQGCTGARDDRTGRVVSIGTHVIIVADTTNPPGGFTTAQYDSIAAEYDSLAHPINVDNFGAPTDLDGNGRAVAFYTRAVNELSPPGSTAVVAGFFTARDLFSAAPESCPKSNEGEMFYMLVPDPTGAVNGNVRTVSFVRGGTVGTMAHELQHLVNAARRIYVNAAPGFEEVWLNEGLSHIAEELVFYRTAPGLAPRQNISLSMLTTGPDASRRVAAFNTYANQNYGRLRPFLQRPDTAGAIKNVDALAVRGAIWGFLRYAADRRGGTEADFWFDLVNTTAAGTNNLQNVLGTDPNPWVRDWITAMYTDDAVAGIDSSFMNLSWNFRSVYGGLGGFPLGIRALSNGVGLTLSYSRGGGTAYARFGVPSGAFAGVTALSGGVPPASPYALAVVRTK